MGHTASFGGKIDEKKIDFPQKQNWGGGELVRTKTFCTKKKNKNKNKNKNETLFPIGKDGWGLVDKK